MATHPPDFIALIRRHYDTDTLRAWIAQYQDSKRDSQRAQVKRWKRTLAILEESR